MTDFEQTVLRDLATLKSQMLTLVGNGQPGRMAKLEERVDEHERFVQRAGGIGAALAALGTMVHFAFDYLRTRHP